MSQTGGLDGEATQGTSYTRRLETLSGRKWKQVLDVQRPYRWNLRRMNLGRVLDVGCGLGRNLANLAGNGVGVDHNPTSVQTARARGLQAFVPDEFDAAPASFDTMLLAHVAEHMRAEEFSTLVQTYLPYLKATKRVVVITPQERGYATDATHVRFVDEAGLRTTAADLGAQVSGVTSFPFPRLAGKLFPYNEFILDCHGAGTGE